MSAWTQTRWDRWDRNDGACVKENLHSPYPNPLDPNCRLWCAYAPDGEYAISYGRRNTWMRIPRRWKTAEAAMQVIDREYPIKEN
jgi:hypothetical protein